MVCKAEGMSTVLIVDAANVVGSRPDGWWKDRAGAARRLHERLLVADVPQEAVVLVLEGAAKAGVSAGQDAHVRVVHAAKDGDSTIVSEARKAAERATVTVVIADRALAATVSAVAGVVGPGWLLDRME